MIRRPPRSTLFPTRRSSDLNGMTVPAAQMPAATANQRIIHASTTTRCPSYTVCAYTYTAWRSEEHTSELQSRVDLVCRLLLEKKKKKKTNEHSINNN